MSYEGSIESINFPNMRVAQTGAIAYNHSSDTKLYWYFTGMNYTNANYDFTDPSVTIIVYGLRLNVANMTYNISGYSYRGIVIGY